MAALYEVKPTVKVPFSVNMRSLENDSIEVFSGEYPSKFPLLVSPHHLSACIVQQFGRSPDPLVVVFRGSTAAFIIHELDPVLHNMYLEFSKAGLDSAGGQLLRKKNDHFFSLATCFATLMDVSNNYLR